jgi:hypothetical protein
LTVDATTLGDYLHVQRPALDRLGDALVAVGYGGPVGWGGPEASPTGRPAYSVNGGSGDARNCDDCYFL